MRILLGCILLNSIAVVGCTEPVDHDAVPENVSRRILTPQPATENRLPDQYIVTLQEGASADVINQVFQQYGIKSIQDLSRGRYLVTLIQDPGPVELAKHTASYTAIVNIQPNYIYRSTPSAQDQPQQSR